MIIFSIHHLRVNNSISCLSTRKADPKVREIATPLAPNVFNAFTWRVHKLNQCTNLIIHDENYTPFVGSELDVPQNGELGGGAYSKGVAYFKFRRKEGRLFEVGANLFEDLLYISFDNRVESFMPRTAILNYEIQNVPVFRRSTLLSWKP